MTIKVTISGPQCSGKSQLMVSLFKWWEKLGLKDWQGHAVVFLESNVDPAHGEETPRHGSTGLANVHGEYERVKHPKHYNSHPSGVECIRIIEPMTFNVGSAMKYLWRAGLKPGEKTLHDLKKAAEYIQFEIARTERGE